MRPLKEYRKKNARKNNFVSERVKGKWKKEKRWEVVRGRKEALGCQGKRRLSMLKPSKKRKKQPVVLRKAHISSHTRKRRLKVGGGGSPKG